jgi:hypothetical protein
MQNRLRTIWLVIVVLSGVYLPADATEKVIPEWEALKAAIERRRAIVPPVHDYELEGVIVYSAELLDFSDEPVTIETSRRYLFDFDHGRVRFENGDPLISDGKGMETALAVTIYDGADGYTLRPPARNSKRAAAQADSKLRHIHRTILMGMPLCWEAGVFFPNDLLEKRVSDLSGKDFKWTSNDSEATLTHKMPNPVGYSTLTYTFSKELDWRVVGYTRHALNKSSSNQLELMETIVVRYETVDGTSVIAGWDLSQAPDAEKSYRVTKRTFRDSVPIEEFQVPPDYLSPGMIVSKDMKPHTVTTAGTLVPWRAGSPLAQSNNSARWLLWIIVPGLLLLTWWWRRKRTWETSGR